MPKMLGKWYTFFFLSKIYLKGNCLFKARIVTTYVGLKHLGKCFIIAQKMEEDKWKYSAVSLNYKLNGILSFDGCL